MRRRRGALLQVVKKEVLEIARDPRLLLGMIIVPMVILPVMGVAVRGFIEEAAQPRPCTVAVLVLDRGGLAEELLNSPGLQGRLRGLNVTLAYLEAGSVEEALSEVLGNESYSALLVLPEGFTESIDLGKPAPLSMYAVVRSVGLIGASRAAGVDVVVDALHEELVKRLASLSGLDPELILEPLDEEVSTVYRGIVLPGVRPGMLMGFMASQLFTMVFAMVIVLMLASQLLSLIHI